MHEDVAELLCERRKAKGLTQTAFAMKYHADPEVYRSWEDGGPLPDVAHAFSLLEMLGADNREKLGLFLGPLMDAIRGLPLSDRGRAFDALDIILKDAPEVEKQQWISDLTDAAASYNGFPKKRSASVMARRNAAKRRPTNGGR